WSVSSMNPIDCDVLASGGGMAGTVAAIAAARHGARTVLFERHGFLGGAATAGAVGQFVGWETAAGRRVIAGLAEEIVQRLEVRARLFIDSSGDLDLMARAGAPFLGLDEGEALQPATMMFRLGPIDFAAFDGMSAAAKSALAARGVAEGALPRAALHCSRVPG